jgi:hypothetical protein
MHIVTRYHSKQVFRRVVTPISSTKSTSRPFSSLVTGRQIGNPLTASTSTRTHVPILMKQSGITMVPQRSYSIPQLQENVGFVHPLSATENLHRHVIEAIYRQRSTTHFQTRRWKRFLAHSRPLWTLVRTQTSKWNTLWVFVKCNALLH